MMISRKCRVESRATPNKEFIPGSGVIQISDDDEGRVYFEADNGVCIAIDLPDLLKAINDSVLVARQRQ